LEGYSENEVKAIKSLMGDNDKELDEAIDIVETLSEFIK
jgi:hypothetical protein